MVVDPRLQRFRPITAATPRVVVGFARATALHPATRIPRLLRRTVPRWDVERTESAAFQAEHDESSLPSGLRRIPPHPERAVGRIVGDAGDDARDLGDDRQTGARRATSVRAGRSGRRPPGVSRRTCHPGERRSRRGRPAWRRGRTSAEDRSTASRTGRGLRAPTCAGARRARVVAANGVVELTVGRPVPEAARSKPCAERLAAPAGDRHALAPLFERRRPADRHDRRIDARHRQRRRVQGIRHPQRQASRHDRVDPPLHRDEQAAGRRMDARAPSQVASEGRCPRWSGSGAPSRNGARRPPRPAPGAPRLVPRALAVVDVGDEPFQALRQPRLCGSRAEAAARPGRPAQAIDERCDRRRQTGRDRSERDRPR